MNIMGEETEDERKMRLLTEAIGKLVSELSGNAKQPQNELHGWDHKWEYRRLRNMAREILKIAKAKS